MSRIYTTKTPSLKATIADIRNLDAKKLTLNGKNILDYISDSEFNSYDTRDPQLKNDELDIWNTAISLSDNGHIEVKPFEHSYDTISSTQSTTIKSAVKVIDNEVLGENDEHIMYWQTDGLTDGNSMFYFSNLESFTSDLSSLTNGSLMFSCSKLSTFECNNLSNLTDGRWMLQGTKIESFPYDLPSLTDGSSMFDGCTKLTSFNGDLSSLTDGSNMFSWCKLDAQSVANIIHTLPTLETNRTINIGIGCTPAEEDQLLFAQECDCETRQELIDDFSAKNWTVYFQCNGRPTTTYNMRRGETLPVYTKLEEVTDENHAQYISADGSKFYNIHYFHSTNGSTEGYDVFSSLEEAISTYNVTPKN